MRLSVALVFVLWVNEAFAGDAEQWTTIKGQIVYDGQPPVPQELNVTADQRHCLEKGKILDEAWVVNKANNGVKNAFVWLASDVTTASARGMPIHPERMTPASLKVEVDQPCCRFVPHAVGVREGQSLVIKNGSPITHNVFWAPANSVKNKGENQTISSGKSIEITNLKQDRLPMTVSCSIHSWMRGYVRVFDSPYFSVTDDDGRFEIKLAPVGKFRLFVWHEDCGWKGGAAGRNGDELDIKSGVVMDLGQLKVKK